MTCGNGQHGPNDRAFERWIRCAGRSAAEQLRRTVIGRARTRLVPEPAEAQAGSVAPPWRGEGPMARIVSLPRGRMPRAPEESRSRPLRSVVAALSRPDAGRQGCSPPQGGTTPGTAEWRSAREPASTRWRGRLLETRWCSLGDRQDSRHQAPGATSGKSRRSRDSKHVTCRAGEFSAPRPQDPAGGGSNVAALPGRQVLWLS